MAHDGFLGEFQDLAWPVAHQAAVVTTAAAGGALFDALQVHVQQAPMGVGAGPGSGWEHDAAMGSLLPSRSPSPSSLAAAAVGGGAVTVDAALMEHLASRLGVIVSSSSRYASCYSSPVGSPSKPAHGPFGAPLLVEDATRLSCIAASGGKLSRGVASSQSLLGERATAPSPGATQQHACDKSSRDSPSRKRKAPEGKTKAKEAATTATPNSRERPETRAKKCKLSADANDEEWKPAAGEAGRGNGKVISEPPKDYIHVRARRGQATDSHSLAERVRREKISERMKLLQDLVPGCSKINGKAVMLDEIINYVQSLQRQVEFLSMKLSTVNPRLEIDVNSFVPRDANQPCAPAASSLLPPPSVYWLEDSSPALCYATSQGTAAASAVTTAKSSATPPNFVNHGSPDDSLEGFHKANSQACCNFV